ncbi:MAG TPA: ThuA domain-containing protein [Candidatus Hydrogenedentes bacterium]|nr:ThuA domain-containing protein [Candidatus Hydrogenedentota bacterium]HOK89157.1 ThuA domain-containing protein [Candidatus Hydrogenedentota bacterium]
MTDGIRVTIWNEYIHERENERVRAVYPGGIHEAIRDALEGQPGIAPPRVATLDMPEHGLPPGVLGNTDVLLWWGHKAHDKVSDAVVEAVCARVLEGMGFIALHSAHFSRPFKRLMGTGCFLKWREREPDGERERIWVVEPSHPIAAGLPDHFVLEHTEMYGEPFGIPRPDELVFISWFAGGEVFRSGCCWRRERGKVFYFRPGHETFPIYHDEHVRRVLVNAVRWAAPVSNPAPCIQGNRPPLEP